MVETEPTERRLGLGDGARADEYNFDHFERQHLLDDVRRTLAASGPAPGDPAPELVLPRVGGGELRLSDLRGRPVLLRFGSFT